MLDSPQVIAAVIAGIVSLMGILVSIALGERKLSREMGLAEQRFKREMALTEEKFKSEMNLARERFTSEFQLAEKKFSQENKPQLAAELAVRGMLLDERWQYRSFKIIKHHLPGFSDDELRKILIGAEAISFKSDSGEELWGLSERTSELVGVQKIPNPRTFKDVLSDGSKVNRYGLATVGGVSDLGLNTDDVRRMFSALDSELNKR